MDITNIAQFGVAGLAVYFMYRISSNHIDHGTKAIEELTKVVRDLHEYLHEHHNTKYNSND